MAHQYLKCFSSCGSCCYYVPNHAFSRVTGSDDCVRAFVCVCVRLPDGNWNRRNEYAGDVGRIPADMCRLKELSKVDLSCNQIEGEVASHGVTWRSVAGLGSRTANDWSRDRVILFTQRCVGRVTNRAEPASDLGCMHASRAASWRQECNFLSSVKACDRG